MIGAYAGMERTLTPQGLGRRPAEAPLEYLRRILGELRASPDAARELTWLDQRAKFSPHKVDEQMRRAAIGALEAVRAGLAPTPPRAGASAQGAPSTPSTPSANGRKGRP